MATEATTEFNFYSSSSVNLPIEHAGKAYAFLKASGQVTQFDDPELDSGNWTCRIGNLNWNGKSTIDLIGQDSVTDFEMMIQLTGSDLPAISSGANVTTLLTGVIGISSS